MCCSVISLWGSFSIPDPCAWCAALLCHWYCWHGLLFMATIESISCCLSHLSHISGGHSGHWTNPLKAFHAHVIISSATFDVPRGELEECESRWKQACYYLVFNLYVPGVVSLRAVLSFSGTPCSRSHSSARSYLEAAQCNQSDLLATEQPYWSSWGLRALLKGTSVVVMRGGASAVLSFSPSRVSDVNLHCWDK